MTKAFYKSPIGTIAIKAWNGAISSVSFVDSYTEQEVTEPVLLDAVRQLEEYFNGKRKEFTLPLHEEGTTFQQQAWNYLKTIPYGTTVSYKEEACSIQSENSCRAVGSANGKNKIAIIVPCHRVVNQNGKLGGYAYGLEIKKYLLELEKKHK